MHAALLPGSHLKDTFVEISMKKASQLWLVVIHKIQVLISETLTYSHL